MSPSWVTNKGDLEHPGVNQSMWFQVLSSVRNEVLTEMQRNSLIILKLQYKNITSPGLFEISMNMLSEQYIMMF